MSARRRAVALALAAFALAGRARAETGEVRRHVVLAPDVGIVARPAVSNDAGISYSPGFATGAHAQLLAAPWMRVSLYFLQARQGVSAPRGAFVPGADTDLGSIGTYVIGARLQPTWSPKPRLHLWASVGAGWGKLQASAAQLCPVASCSPDAPPGYRLDGREGVFVELPLGLGGEFEILARRLGVGVDVAWAPLTSQGGALHEPIQAVDAAGKLVRAAAMPELASSLTAVVSLTLQL